MLAWSGAECVIDEGGDGVPVQVGVGETKHVASGRQDDFLSAGYAVEQLLRGVLAHKLVVLWSD